MVKAVQNSIEFKNGQWCLWVLDRKRSLSMTYLSGLYAAYRHLIKEEHHIDVCANFYRTGNYVKCVFSLNTVYRDTASVNDCTYTFQSTFSSWGLGFKILAQSIVYDIEHANRYSEDGKEQSQQRIFEKHILFLKEMTALKNKQEHERRKLHEQNKAAKKAAKAARVAKALAKKAAQQNFDQKD